MVDVAKASRAAEQAAYAAGTHLQASRSRLAEVVITRQAPGDVVVAIQREVVALMREVLAKRFPDHGFVCSDDEHNLALLADGRPEWLADQRPAWVVEPLNGVANYLRGYPQYAVSIALVEAGEPMLGVIYDPSRNEFFGAIRGHGAVLNGEPIRCAAPRALVEALAATVFPKPTHPRMSTYIAELGRVLRAFGGVRRSGSMALELAYLAAGRIDAFWAHDVNARDATAGIVLLRESGALIKPRDGRHLLASRALQGCTPSLQDAFVGLLAEP